MDSAYMQGPLIFEFTRLPGRLQILIEILVLSKCYACNVCGLGTRQNGISGLQTDWANVKLFLCLLIKHYVMNAYGGVDVLIHVFLTSTLVGGEWSASHSGRFTPGERARGSHWVGDWVGHRAGLDNLEKWKFLFLLGTDWIACVITWTGI
jgi:hypothetical protein